MLVIGVVGQLPAVATLLFMAIPPAVLFALGAAAAWAAFGFVDPEPETRPAAADVPDSYPERKIPRSQSTGRTVFWWVLGGLGVSVATTIPKHFQQLGPAWYSMVSPYFLAGELMAGPLLGLLIGLGVVGVQRIRRH